MLPGIPSPRNLRQFLEQIVERSPEAAALLYLEQRLTYREFDRRVNRAANLFAAAGIQKGDKVAILLPNCPEYLYVWFGLAKLGAVQVPINTRLIGDALRYQLVNSDSRLAVVDQAGLPAYLDIRDGVLALEQTWVRPVGESDVPIPAGCHDLIAGLSGASDSPPPPVDIAPSDPLVIMYTSGTTGLPKGVVNCHNVYLRIAADLHRLMGLSNLDRMYVFLPLFHGNPQMMGVMPILDAGGTIALSPRFSATRFWQEVRAYHATAFTHIGSPLAILLKQPESPHDADNPIRVILGGAPPEVSSAFGRRFNCTILDGWGMIEAGCNTTITPVDHIVPGSNGFPRECFDVRIVDEGDREVPPGVVGQIVVRPLEPLVMFSGYYKEPEKTLEAFQNLWFHSGDLGMKREDGSLYFLGRARDAIRRKGENISSAEIENVLNSHPKIQEAVVVGVPDEIAGQEIKACIVLQPGERLTADDVIVWCRSRLSEFMIPRYIAFKKEFEKTGSEKVQRYKLREEGLAGAYDRQSAAVL